MASDENKDSRAASTPERHKKAIHKIRSE
jgi:hypothetical protein